MLLYRYYTVALGRRGSAITARVQWDLEAKGPKGVA